MNRNDYRIEGMPFLLQEDCILQRYDPLIPYSLQVSEGLLALGVKLKSECEALTDDQLTDAGLPAHLTGLFRRFLRLYDAKSKDIRDIPDAQEKPPEEIAALLELMRLPGVKAVRAGLYYHCGLRSLEAFAASDAGQLRMMIAETIRRDGLSCTPPQPKELRTQIVVARVLTQYAALPDK